MRHPISLLFLGLTIGAGAPLRAQTPTWVEQLLTATRLPIETMEARREGVANEDIRSVLEAMRRERVPAHEAVAVIDTARAVRRQHGPVDNFGAFVQSQLASGKRGRELAAAIRAEHARRGKGNAARGGDANRGQGGADRARGADSARGDTARGRGRSNARPGQPPDTGRKSGNPGRGRGRPNP